MQASILDAFNLSRERIVCNWLSLIFSAAAGVYIDSSFLALLVYANGLVFFNFAFFTFVLYSNFKKQFRFELYQFYNLKQLFREFFLPHVGTNTYMIVLDSGSKMLLGASSYGNFYQYELIYKGNMLANILLQAFVNSRFKKWLTHFRQDKVNCLRDITFLGFVLFSCANLAVVFYLLTVFDGPPIDVPLLSAVSFGVVLYAITSLWVYLSAFSGDTSRVIFGNASGIVVAVLSLFVFDVSAKYFVAVACGGFVTGVVVRSLVFARSHN
jgi:hypothetical protein